MSTEIISDKNVQEVRASINGLTREYRDLSLSFRSHPGHGDVRPLRDLAAIKNSVKNILSTNRGEKPFNPQFGCGLKNYLFEPADAITKASMRKEIYFSLGQQEPRIKVLDVVINDYPDKNAYEVTITGLVVTTNENVVIELFLERLR